MSGGDDQKPVAEHRQFPYILEVISILTEGVGEQEFSGIVPLGKDLGSETDPSFSD